MENNNTILDVSGVSEDQIEHLRRSQKVLNLQMLCITKLKTLLIKSLSNQPIRFFKSTHCKKIRLLFDITVLKILGKFQEKC